MFVPTAGEELDLLENTMRHLDLLEWPGELRRVCILDDSGRAHCTLILQRTTGSPIWLALGRSTKRPVTSATAPSTPTARVVAIFDADFVPRPDFLLELVPYMEDPSCRDRAEPPVLRHDQADELDPAVRRVYPGAVLPVHPAVPRRSRRRRLRRDLRPLPADRTRRHRRLSGDRPVEDIYTGLWMHDVRYSTRYVPVTVSKGVTPSNVDNFIAQQYRWCEGSMTMLATRLFHATPNLPLGARLCYWSGFLYYVSTALSSLIIPLPAIIMASLSPEWVRPWNTIWLAGTLALWLVVYPLVMRGRWRIEVLRIQTVYGFAHLFNIVDLIKGQVVEWHPTGSKAPAPIAVKVKRFYTVYLGLALIVVAVGLTLRTAEDGFTLFAGMLVFFMFNLYVVGPLVVSGIGDQLKSRRQAPVAERSTASP